MLLSKSCHTQQHHHFWLEKQIMSLIIITFIQLFFKLFIICFIFLYTNHKSTFAFLRVIAFHDSCPSCFFLDISLVFIIVFLANCHASASYFDIQNFAVTITEKCCFYRVQAIGLLIAISRIGASFSPFIMSGLKYIHESLPFALLGIFNLFAGLLCLYLRETNNTPSPDTIDECLILMNKKDAEHPH